MLRKSEDRLRLGNKISELLCIALDLHYFCTSFIKKQDGMRLKIGVLMIVFGVLLGSCGKKVPSFKEKKKAEREAIDGLIAREGFVILDRYPANGVFGEKEFVKLDNECYLNVIDPGNGNMADSSKTVVLMRCSYIGIAPQDTFSYSIFSNAHEPLEFVYGKIFEAKARTYQSTYSNGYIFFSAGVESALEFVGENAIVRMIIPFDNGQNTKYPYGIGSSYQDEIGIPMYLDRVRFVFDSY